MRMFTKLFVFAVLAGMSHIALAQAPQGYNVTWGNQSVPISPWLSMAIGLMLLFATYAFIRRRAGQGLVALAAAVTLVGGLVLHTENAANAVPATYSITTPSGTQFFNCTFPLAYSGYTNNSGAAITMTLVPVNGAPTNNVSGFLCLTNTPFQLNPGQSCIPPCAT